MPTTIFDIAFGLFCRIQATLSSLLIYGMIAADEKTAEFIVFSAILTDFIRFLLRNQLFLSITVGSCAVLLGLFVVFGALFEDVGNVISSNTQNVPIKLNPGSPFLSALDRAGGADVLLGISRGFSLMQNGIFILFSYENSQKLRKPKSETRGASIPLFTVFVIFSLQIFFLFISAAPVHAGIFNIHFAHGAGAYVESMSGRLLLVFPLMWSSVGVFLAAGFSWIGLNSWKVARQLSRERQG